ncbi:hypothetical protein [Mycobacteroides abscessus]|uniref:hypothetical protein n=1 Tax=Mycobacteroides abscessus TaxID=36809 RepID=UPI001042000F|nr:hypothetical protein [Mycobacteroides abscessus]
MDRFDPRQLQAIQLAVQGLYDILFYEGQDIFDGDRVRTLYLVEYLSTGRLNELGQFLAHFVSRSADSNPPPVESLTDFLENWLVGARDELLYPPTTTDKLLRTDSEQAALHRWQVNLGKLGRAYARNLEAIDALNVTEQAKQATLEARDAALAAAGQTGATTIGDHFSKVAAKAAKDSDFWTRMTIGSIFAIVLTGIGVLYWSRNSALPETLVHLVLVLPLVGLASYTARIAKYHQILGRWAEASSVLIDSIPAFAKQISDTGMREKLILELSHGVFTKPIFGDEGKTEHVSPLPPDLVNLLKDIAAKLPSRPS